MLYRLVLVVRHLYLVFAVNVTHSEAAEFSGQSIALHFHVSKQQRAMHYKEEKGTYVDLGFSNQWYMDFFHFIIYIANKVYFRHGAVYAANICLCVFSCVCFLLAETTDL